MITLNILKDKGYRITKPREEVLKILNDYPLSVTEIFSSLSKKNINIDLASIYRTLELFKQKGMVAEIDLGEGKKRYELAEGKNHHHHLVCNNCASIQDISVHEDKMIGQLQKKYKFLVQNHSLEIFGLCNKCQH